MQEALAEGEGGGEGEGDCVLRFLEEVGEVLEARRARFWSLFEIPLLRCCHTWQLTWRLGTLIPFSWYFEPSSLANHRPLRALRSCTVCFRWVANLGSCIALPV